MCVSTERSGSRYRSKAFCWFPHLQNKSSWIGWSLRFSSALKFCDAAIEKCNFQKAHPRLISFVVTFMIFRFSKWCHWTYYPLERSSRHGGGGKRSLEKWPSYIFTKGAWVQTCCVVAGVPMESSPPGPQGDREPAERSAWLNTFLPIPPPGCSYAPQYSVATLHSQGACSLRPWTSLADNQGPIIWWCRK